MRKPPRAKIIDVSTFTAQPKCGKVPDLFFLKVCIPVLYLKFFQTWLVKKYICGQELDHAQMLNVDPNWT